jgi:hypothetical protein
MESPLTSAWSSETSVHFDDHFRRLLQKSQEKKRPGCLIWRRGAHLIAEPNVSATSAKLLPGVSDQGAAGDGELLKATTST